MRQVVSLSVAALVLALSLLPLSEALAQSTPPVGRAFVDDLAVSADAPIVSAVPISGRTETGFRVSQNASAVRLVASLKGTDAVLYITWHDGTTKRRTALNGGTALTAGTGADGVSYTFSHTVSRFNDSTTPVELVWNLEVGTGTTVYMLDVQECRGDSQ